MNYLGAAKSDGNATINGRLVTRNDILDLGISDKTLSNLENSTEEVKALYNAIKILKGELGGRSAFKLFENQIASATAKIKAGGKDNIAQGIGEIGAAIVQFSPAVKQFGNDLGTIFGNDEIGNKIGDVTDAFSGLAQTGAGMAQIMSGDIVGGAMAAVGGIAQ